MPSYYDGNWTAWKDTQRIVPSHSTKYGKKSLLGLKKKEGRRSCAVDFQGSVVRLWLPVSPPPPVHVLMSHRLIVSSYFNLQCWRRGGAAHRRSVGIRARDEMRGRRDDGPWKRRQGRGYWLQKEWRGGGKKWNYVRGGEKQKCLTRTVRRWGTSGGWMRAAADKPFAIFHSGSF